MSFIIDKIKVQQNLVYGKYTHQLIGYIDLGDPQLNFSTFNNVMHWQVIHQFFFYLRGVLCDFEFAMIYIGTGGATAYQIFPLFWDAVEFLESTCDLKFITVISDGASPNHHLQLDQDPDCNKV